MKLFLLMFSFLLAGICVAQKKSPKKYCPQIGDTVLVEAYDKKGNDVYTKIYGTITSQSDNGWIVETTINGKDTSESYQNNQLIQYTKKQ